MPQYPGQRNPDVASVTLLFSSSRFYNAHILARFISEIASFELKPFFLIGATITAVCFIVTITAVHVIRYEPGFALTNPPECSYDAILHSEDDIHGDNLVAGEDEHYEDDNTTKTLRVISLLSIIAAVAASVFLILFGIMDTLQYPEQHEMFTRSYFAALSLQAAGTGVVYGDEVTGYISYLLHRCQWKQDWGGRNLRVRLW
ncbi:hypothetical protein PHISCL_05145 [Aspergillus sclerotialis]|uniref:Uncharacterized protein n=1 Tax=Aspergillus sclerotialis TaxID=2070753 RepID=A0A3A2ZHC4_9EURO|nr:hypothetical protein PHISCL_05145 [Aspergillus sclerotialis]